jgi:thiol:disulfide interchange protein DsbD
MEWLVCKVECIPGFASLKFERPVHAQASRWGAEDEALTKKFAARIPGPADAAKVKIESASAGGGELLVRVSVPDDRRSLPLELFPLDGEFVTPAAPVISADGKDFVFKTAPAVTKAPASVGFVVSSGGEAWEISGVPLSAAAPVANTPVPSQGSLWLLLLSAFVGGFILNLMPCVFPVISLKAFSLVKVRGKARAIDCLLYSAGVVVTFAALGGVFLALRALGSDVGWGFQLQSPLAIFVLILLFWLMALNFLGAFELGTGVMNVAGRFAGKSSSFGSGILSVFVAAPCTGPFMGTALGAAAVRPALSGFLIFFSLGLGLASPFIVFAIAPRTLAWLPKPGAWMETLKQFFAFPLFATVLWLLWVLGIQTESRGWILVGAMLLALSFAIWLGRSRHRSVVLIAWIIALGAIGWTGSRLASPQTLTAKSAWLPYDEKVLQEARAKGRPVFVDFTAAWCITCQVNKQVVLDTEAGQAAFRKQGVTLMRADWTKHDPVITMALSRLGRNSVPVYAYYPSGASEPKLLPQILTLSMIEDLSRL